jgi:hypothetical protein
MLLVQGEAGAVGGHNAAAGATAGSSQPEAAGGQRAAAAGRGQGGLLIEAATSWQVWLTM